VNGFLDRLKQRKIVQWALAYVAASFALIQVIDIVAQRFGWPEQTIRFLIIALAIGFFVTLVLAWYHGEHGVQRVDGPELLILALLLAIGGTVAWRFAPTQAAPSLSETAASKAPAALDVPVSDKSIAVLPLANESGDSKDDYFSDGLSEDLITALSQFSGLKVISRNSSFQFRDSKDDSRSIGEKLGVAHLLEGSVRRAGDAVRISAALVKAADGSTSWSQHYDRPYKDLFKLQDDITDAVAASLKAKLLTDSGAVVQSDRPASGNLEAYKVYLEGKSFFLKQTEDDTHKAIALYQEATRLDPKYASAYVSEASAWTLLAGTFLTGTQVKQAYANAHSTLDKALALDSNLAAAYGVKGRLLLWDDFDWAGSAAAYRRAAELAPSDDKVISGLAESQATSGHPERAVELMRQALTTDSLYATHHFWLGIYLTALNRLDEAEKEIRTVIELQPSTTYTYEQLAQIEILRGDAKAAVEAALKTAPSVWRTIGLSLSRQIGDDRAAADAALKELIDTAGDSAAIQVAETYALRKDPDHMFEWLERAWVGHDPAVSGVLYDPILGRYWNDPRFGAYVKKVGLPWPVSNPLTGTQTASTLR
jgi:TolB-like protein/Flp pilus assembly protein TadD